MRTFNLFAETKAMPASSTVNFTSNAFPRSGIVGIPITMSGTGAGVGSGLLEKVVVKADAQPIIEFGHLELVSFYQRFHHAHYNLVSTSTTFILPCNLFDRPNDAQADECQLPWNVPIDLELTFGATADGTGTVGVGALRSTVRPAYSPLVLRQTMGVPSGQSAYPVQVPLRRGAVLRGLGLRAGGELDKLEVQFNGVTTHRLEGPGALNHTKGLQIFDGVADTYPQNYFWLPQLEMPVTEQSRCDLLLTTGGAWAGTTETMTTWQVVPVARPGK